MALKVPSAGDLGLGRNVPTRAVPTVFQNLNVNADQFGAGQGRNIQKVGQAISKGADVYAQVIEKQSKADSYNAMNKAEADVRETHYNPETGIYTRKGVNALGSYKDSQTAIDDIYTKSVDGLNKLAKRNFDVMWAQKRNNVLNSSARFEAQQRNVYKAESTNALIDNNVNNAIQNYNNPETVRESAGLINFVIEDSVGEAPEGASNEEIVRRNEILEKKKTEAFDRMHTGIISKFASNGQTKQAKEYYKRTKKQISGLNQIKIESLLQEGTLREASQKQFDRISGSGKDRTEQLKMARSINNPEVRDETLRRVKASWNEPENIEAQKKNLIKNEAWSQILDGTAPEQLELPVWTSLDTQTKRDMEKYAIDGSPEKSDLGTYLLLKDRMNNDEEGFKETNMMDNVMKLNDVDFKYFSDIKKDLLNNDRTKVIANRSTTALVQDRLNAVGIDSTKKEGKEARQTATFNRKLDENLQVFVDDNKRNPKSNEIEEIIDSMLVNGEYNDTGFFSDDDAFLFEAEEKALAGEEVQFNVLTKQDYFNLPKTFVISDVEQLPSSVVDDIAKILQEHGLKTSNANIIGVANNQIKRGR